MAEPRAISFAGVSVPENYDQRLAPVIFEPWAEILVQAAAVRPGHRVLDVASGTGVVARAAARRAGPDGRVVASDVSAGMLERGAVQPASPAAAPIERVEAPAAELPFPDGAFDAVLCQQGIQFFDDRPAAVREMARVTRDEGVVALAVWAADHRLEPFDDYAEALAATGVEPPMPGAFAHATFVMDERQVRGLFDTEHCAEVEVSTFEHIVTWPSAEHAAAGILGTPFAQLLSAMEPAARAAFDAALIERFAGPDGLGPISRTTASIIARATIRR